MSDNLWLNQPYLNLYAFFEDHDVAKAWGEALAKELRVMLYTDSTMPLTTTDDYVGVYLHLYHLHDSWVVYASGDTDDKQSHFLV